MPKHPVEKIVEATGGTIEKIDGLPGGFGFATVSMPLSQDHWLYKSHEGHEPPPMLMRMEGGKGREQVVKAIWAAVKYALRVSTANGQHDYDPDAVCQNVVVGLIGYHTANGLAGEDDWANPNPVPPRFVAPEEWVAFRQGADKSTP